MAKSLIQQRRQARFLLIQALYQWQLSEHPMLEVLQQFQLNPQMQKADQTYFAETFRAITSQVDQLDALYQSHLDREITEVDPIEKAILRLASYEFSQRLDIPYRVVINEALELAKIFGATDSHKYINGVLDKTAKQLRSTEINL